MLISWTYFMRSVKSISHFYTASVLQGLEVKNGMKSLLASHILTLTTINNILPKGQEFGTCKSCFIDHNMLSKTMGSMCLSFHLPALSS